MNTDGRLGEGSNLAGRSDVGKEGSSGLFDLFLEEGYFVGFRRVVGMPVGLFVRKTRLTEGLGVGTTVRPFTVGYGSATLGVAKTEEKNL